MPAQVMKLNNKYRVVEPNGTIVKNAKGGPVDGGGHSTRAKAQAQASAINASQAERGKK